MIFRLCCISPVLAAKVLPGVEVTVGHEEEEGGKWPYAGTAQAITALGAKHKVKDVNISFSAHVRCYVSLFLTSLYLLLSSILLSPPLSTALFDRELDYVNISHLVNVTFDSLV